MRNQVIKLACGLLTVSLMGCGVTSEVATHHPGATLSSPAYAEPASGQPAPATSRPTAEQASSSRPAVSAPPLAATTTRRSGASLAPPPAEALRPDSAAAPVLGAANRRIQSGRILDEAGQPLVGATVLVQGTSRGTSSDANGDYSLPVPLGTNTFVFAYSGYQDEVAQSRDGQPLTVTLLPIPGQRLAAPEPKVKTHPAKIRGRKAQR